MLTTFMMLWWDWKSAQRWRLVAAMLAVSATPWLVLGWLPHQLGAFMGGTAFLTIPQMIAWFLFVGLRTGRMPVRGGIESRTESPGWFWGSAAMYAAILLLYLWIIVAFVTDWPMPSL